MTTEIKMTEKLETVTYGPEGHPEISGYGDQIECTAIVDISRGAEKGELLITIGNRKFFPEQLEEMIKKAKAFEAAAKMFYKKVQ